MKIFETTQYDQPGEDSSDVETMSYWMELIGIIV